MKVIKKTDKYYHVRLSSEELELLTLAIKQETTRKEKEAKEKAYVKWFFENHEEISYQDEYSSWHSYWRTKDTKKEVQPLVDRLTLMCYKPLPLKEKK